MTRTLSVLIACAISSTIVAQAPPAGGKLKEEMRMPWSRSNERFIRRWLVQSDLPGGFDKDLLGGEAAIRPTEKTPKWRNVTAWGDTTDLSDGAGLKRGVVGYAFTTVSRPVAGKALLSVGSDESIRVWLNGALVLDRRTNRQHTWDEDQVEVDMQQGDNALLVKLEQLAGPWIFSARVLERGAIPPRMQEIGPSFVEQSAAAVTLKTDINKDRAALDKVTVVAVGAGGRVVSEKTVARGETVRFETAAWPDGAYEFRCSTRKLNGLLYATHLAWYKGDAMIAARALVAAAAKADARSPEGITTKMLGDMVLDRLGKDLGSVSGNPWWAIHAPLMEYEELKLEAAGKPARARPYGFVRLAYIDEVDGSPQFCRAYLPGGYDPAKKWPLVVKIHGYNPANPDYVRWWSADSRHNMADVEYGARQGVIYMEPHGRGNTTYLGLGDQDVVRVIQLAKQRFSVDEDRVYLVGDSMGGWGTWNVATRHPDLFAAIAPIFGGADYHSQLSEEQLGKLDPVDKFLLEKSQSSWAMGEGLLHLPILVNHGDVDQSVNVDYSRYGVRLLQRWGYNVRYVELPGYGHEEMNVMPGIIEWLLQHRRVKNPPRVRLRSAELQNASVYWARVDQAASPKEFMVVDAEVTGPNTIRVDSENALALTLSPGSLVDAAKPVAVVWNGEARTARVEDGRIRLRAAGYTGSPSEKNSRVAGPIGDIFNTPFAIVAGTASADPAMNEICRRKADAAVAFWKQWQRQPPRVFKDTELTDKDAARYSLLLIGGPDGNLVARRLKLPVEIAADALKIGGRSFPAKDARVQVILPNPLNAERYVLLVAATSPDGLYFWTPERVRNAEFDFAIEDGRMAHAPRVPIHELWIAGGWFDRHWKVQDDLVIAGNADVRAKSIELHAPKPGFTVDPKVLDSYAGAYRMMPGIPVTLERKGGGLAVRVREQPAGDLVAVSDTEFLVLEGPVKVVFEKDAAGKVVSFKGWQNGQEFTAKRME